MSYILNSQINTFRAAMCGLMSLWLCSSFAAVPEAKWMFESAPAIESEAAKQSSQCYGANENSPLHVRIVQSPDESASANEHNAQKRAQEDLKAQIRSANAAEKQVVLTGGAVAISIFGTIGLFVTIWFTRASVQQAVHATNAANANTASLISAERAYIKMSILDPGVQWREDDRQFYVKVTVKNFGRTPAAVTDTRIHASIREHGDLLPTEWSYPPRDGEARHSGFLVPGEDFPFEKNFPRVKNSPKSDSSKRLWIFGHVDYIALGNRYRYGFARLYEPVLNGSSRNIIPATEGTYDFDKERKQGEGDDW